MPVSSFFRKVGKTASDNIVGVASGSTPISGLDNPKFYRSIVLLGLLALVASGWLVFHAITGATALPKVATTNTSNTNANGIAALNALKNKETDGDGISDYDELYSTHTSPYLKDSDGDGISDNVEIKNGTDPNCPQGKVCEGFRLLTSITDTNGNLTPAFLRQALSAAGVPQTTLDATSDANLLSMYQQATKRQAATNTNSNININSSVTNSPTTNTPANTNSSSALSLQEIKNLAPATIRTLMVQNGVDRATVDSIDDATLRQIFQQAVTSSGQ